MKGKGGKGLVNKRRFWKDMKNPHTSSPVVVKIGVTDTHLLRTNFKNTKTIKKYFNLRFFIFDIM